MAKKSAAEMGEDDARAAAFILQKFKMDAEKAIAELRRRGAAPALIKQARKSYRRAEAAMAELALNLKSTTGNRN
jgi:hypothetical protein